MTHGKLVMDTAEEAVKLLEELIKTPQLVELDFHFTLGVDEIPMADYRIKHFVIKEGGASE